MEVTSQGARQSLDEVQRVMGDMRAALGRGSGSAILMVWGAVWFIAFGMAQFRPHWAGPTWLVLDALGVCASIALGVRAGRRAPVRSTAQRRQGWRVFWFWMALSAYANLWGFLFGSADYVKIEMFITTVVMFAYVTMGLWLESPFIAWLGLAVTAVAVAGYALLPGFFNLWMALSGGGALFGAGLYMRLRWK